MATDLQVDERVMVPCSRFPALQQRPTAFYETTVREVARGSVRVDLPSGQSDWIGKGLVRRTVGTLIIRVGDFSTEDTLLDPLAKSILQFCRLLLEDDRVRLLEIRGMTELATFWHQHHGPYSHVVLIGHGREEAIQFGVDGWISAVELAEELARPDPEAKTLISLCCRHGYAAFGQELSRSRVAEAVLAPFQSIHGAIASQFCQTFLAKNLLEGTSVKVSFKHARDAVPGSGSFRLWEEGVLTAGQGKAASDEGEE